MADLVCVHVHYAGEVVHEDVVSYRGGQVRVFPNADPDTFGVIEFKELFNMVGYDKYKSIWYTTYSDDKDKGLIELRNDKDVICMLGDIVGCKNVHVFIEHTTDVVIRKENQEFDDEACFVGTDSGTDLGDESNVDELFKVEREGPLVGFNIEVGKEMDWNDMDSDSEALHSLCDSSEDDRRATYPVFHEQIDPRDTKFQVGQLFHSMDKLKDAINDYAVYHFKNIRFMKNEARRLRARCVNGCPFLLYASLLPDGYTVQVKTYVGNHTCTRQYRNKRMSSKWIARNIVGTVRSNTNIPAATLQATISERWGIGVTRTKAARARRLAKKIIEWDHTEQYKRVRDYCMEVLRANPGSSCIIHAEQPCGADETSEQVEGKFVRLYMCLSACKRGFIEACRPFIGLDGCHLKGPCGGMLLVAVGVDPNNQIFPVAIAVCEGETKESWIWFLERLAADIGFGDGDGWTIMSDQQKGLLPAIMRVVPGVQQRFCVRHLYSNFKKQYPGLLLKETMWRAARATYTEAYELQMNKLKELNNGAWEWLSRYGPRLWSRSGFCKETKYDALLNNICESFNASIVEAREKHIISLMECFRESTMNKFQRNREKMETWEGTICPRVLRILEKTKARIGEWIAKYAGDGLYEIQGFYHKYIVNLRLKSCSCRKWEISGIPCVHAVVAIFNNNDDLEKYVADCYHITTYRKCYNYVVCPINGADMWPKSGLPGLLPPKYNRAPGRPRKARRKEPDEQNNSSKLRKTNQQQRCGKCKQFGHNQRGCTEGSAQVNPPQPRRIGRPRKASSSVGGQPRKKRHHGGEVGTQESTATNL